MTATVLGRHQLVSLLFLILVAPGTRLRARATTDCTSGFISLDRLVRLATKPELISLADQGRLSVSPQINFTCDGNITKWIMGGSWDSSINILSGPELQVWRANKSSPNNYHKVGRTFIAVAVENSSSRVYEYPVNPPLPVEAGDVLGIYQPAQSVSRLKVLYERGSGPVTLYQTPHNSENFPEAHGAPTQSHSSLPLVTVELVPMLVSVSTKSISVSVSETPGGGTDMPASFPAIAAGVAVGVVIVMTILVIVVVVLIHKNKKRRQSLSSARHMTLSNPVYDSGFRQTKINSHQVSNDPANGFPSETTLEDKPDTGEHFSQTPVYETSQFNDGICSEAVVENKAQMVNSDSDEYFFRNPVYGTPKSKVKAEKRQVTVEESAGPSDGSLSVPIYSTVQERHQSQQSQQFFKQEKIYWEPASDSVKLYSQLASHKYREIPRSQIRTTDNLGSGQFGTVDKGVWLAPWGHTNVAVKKMKDGSTEEDRVKFLREAAIMGQFFHPNVVKLFGVVTIKEQPMIVEELMPHGALREYLHTLRPVPGELVAPDVEGLCLKFCLEVASGMEYLSKKTYVHRDLSARNILVSEDKVCKIADFGMTRDIEKMDYYTSSGGQIPVKWTAPEALEFKKYSTASDVWSFGAVMYEIWSLGHKPFEGYSNPQTFRKVMDGFRLPPPPGCPRAVYQLMIDCWHPKSRSRPSFSSVATHLSQSESSLLSWSETDAASHPNATTLGAELEDGHNMYLDLQKSYLRR